MDQFHQTIQEWVGGKPVCCVKEDIEHSFGGPELYEILKQELCFRWYISVSKGAEEGELGPRPLVYLHSQGYDQQLPVNPHFHGMGVGPAKSLVRDMRRRYAGVVVVLDAHHYEAKKDKLPMEEAIS